MSDKKLSSIYLLRDPNGEIKYVGKCSCGISIRVWQHIYHAKGKNPKTDKKTEWIKELLDRNQKPEIELIEKVEKEYALDREKYWIERFNDEGHDLLNREIVKRKSVSEYSKRIVYKTDEGLINSLVRFKEKYGHFPKSKTGHCSWCEEDKEKCRSIGVPNIATFIKRIGSYVESCKMADKILGVYEDGKYSNYSDEELLRLLNGFKERYGNYPVAGYGNKWNSETKERAKEFGLPLYITYNSRFGGIVEAKRLAERMARN